MSYTIRKFDANTGQIEVEFSNMSEDFLLDVPIQQGQYYNGDVLDRFIESFNPKAFVARQDALNAGPGGGADIVRRVVARPPPAAVFAKQFPSESFFSRFSPVEHRAFAALALTDVDVKLFYDHLLLVDLVDVEERKISMGLDNLISEGVIKAARKNVILQTVRIN